MTLFGSTPSFSRSGTAAIPPPEPKRPFSIPLVNPIAADLSLYFPLFSVISPCFLFYFFNSCAIYP